MTDNSSREALMKRARVVWANKKLGQNFFVDPNRLEKIAMAIEPGPGDQVVEIGPGLGFLTEVLATTGAKVTAVEFDKVLADKLTQTFAESPYDSVSIIHGDFLSYDLALLDAPELKIIGNIPYQITSPILSRLFGEIGKPKTWLPRIKTVVMTIQMEVAERLVARPGTKEYSQLTVLKNYFFDAEILFTVPPDCFFPQPEINSAVVKLTPLAGPPIECRDHNLLRTVIRCGFKQRRKMLKNNLGVLKLNEKELGEILRGLNINPHTRAEDLDLFQFALLTDALSERKISE